MERDYVIYMVSLEMDLNIVLLRNMINKLLKESNKYMLSDYPI